MAVYLGMFLISVLFVIFDVILWRHHEKKRQRARKILQDIGYFDCEVPTERPIRLDKWPIDPGKFEIVEGE